MVYVSGGDTVTPVNAMTGQTSPLSPWARPPKVLALADGGRSAWVCGGMATLVHVDLSTGAVLGHVSVGGQPAGIVIANQPTAGSTR